MSLLPMGALAIALTCAQPALALEFIRVPIKQGVVIHMEGIIEHGDLDKLVAFAKRMPKTDNVIALSLNSPGGYVHDATLIAEFVADIDGIMIGVSKGNECVSACFIIFAAAKHKVASVGSRIGVHSVSRYKEEAYAWTTVMARTLARFKVPPSIIGRMVITPIDQMAWLTRTELESMNVQILALPTTVAAATPAPASIPQRSAATDRDRALNPHTTFVEPQSSQRPAAAAARTAPAMVAKVAQSFSPGSAADTAASQGAAAYDRGDYKTALSILQPLGETGNPVAQYFIGVMNLKGQGTDKNVQTALGWFQKSASAGYSMAQSYMGAFSRRGDLISQNYVEALRWYLLAAKQNHENAQYRIALMHRDGEGVQRDLREAYMWAVIASAGGEPQPNQLRMNLERNLSAAEIAVGQQKALTWRSTNLLLGEGKSIPALRP